MGADSENSIHRVAAQGFCLLLGQYASLYRPGRGRLTRA
jgi:hypothetical protein